MVNVIATLVMKEVYAINALLGFLKLTEMKIRFYANLVINHVMYTALRLV